LTTHNPNSSRDPEDSNNEINNVLVASQLFIWSALGDRSSSFGHAAKKAYSSASARADLDNAAKKAYR